MLQRCKKKGNMSKPNDWFGIKCDKHQDQLLYVLNVIFQQQKKKHVYMHAKSQEI